VNGSGGALTGQILGSYRVQKLIGSGGMGEVYSAWDLKLKREVAIKVLPVAFGQDRDRISRFQREAETLASLNHPHIAAIYDLQKIGSTHFLVLELIDGETLADRIARGPVPLNEAVKIATQITGALEAAHERGIIHRDIKAGNIMLTRRQQIKVLDFGLAKHSAPFEGDITVNALTATGVIAGTPQYLSPEVLQGATADARSDVWAFGVVLYAALAGRLPFTGATLLEISSAILKDSVPPLPASVSPPLRALVSRCLEKKPERRISTASEIRTALEALQSAAPPTAAVHRRRWLWIAAAAAATTLSGVAWWRTATPPVKMLSTGGPPSPNPEANDLFELATTLAAVQNNIPQALETFNRALAIDPQFSEARRSHAFYLVIHLLNGYTNDATQLYSAEDELRQVAAEASGLVNLPPSQTALYVVLGRKELVPLAKLDQTVRENPHLMQPGIWRGILYLLAEQNKQAKDIFADLLKEVPTRGAPRQLLGEILRTEGDLQGAIRAEQRVLEQAPANISAIWVLSTAYIDQGDLAAARALLEEKQPLFQGNYLWKHSWALLLAAEGKRDEALRAMDEGNLRFADVMFWATTPTVDFYALLGEHTKALNWLEKAVRNGDERINYFGRNPRLAVIRDDPRFQSIIRSVEARRPQGR
jgi:serine/threonine protein kinase